MTGAIRNLVLLGLMVGGVAGLEAQGTAASTVHARGDISGDWQGTLQVGKSLRLILRFAKADTGFSGKMYSIDQTPQPFALSSVSVDGAAVKLGIDVIGGGFVGTLSGDGGTIAGTWTQGAASFPLTLVRATTETAWEIPTPPAPPKMMAEDANPSFDVATIKPNDSGGATMQQLTIQGRDFKTVNSSLGDLISFAYDVQQKQIVGAPEWMTKDRYDVSAVPDAPGAPSAAQLRLMIRKLLTERFKLAFHKDRREMAAYVLSVAKTGQKLKPTELKGPLPGIGFVPAKGGLNLIARNASMTDLTGVLQSFVLDRPVVDQTGLAGRYDMLVNFLPDDSQFNGHPPIPPKQDGAAEVPPSLFDAMPQQLGLRLEAQKTAVEVMAVDHVEKPSAN
jgi:uncharacterized protein (TIGR03435 family)